MLMFSRAQLARLASLSPVDRAAFLMSEASGPGGGPSGLSGAYRRVRRGV